MNDMLDKELDKFIQNLEKLQHESDKESSAKKSHIRIVGHSDENQDTQSNQNTKRELAGNEEKGWGTQENVFAGRNWDTQDNCQTEEDAISIIHRPGEYQDRLGRFFDGVSSNITAERVLEVALLLATIIGIICIITNFNTVILALFTIIAGIILAIEKFVLFFITIAGCVLIAQFIWRGQYRRRH